MIKYYRNIITCIHISHIPTCMSFLFPYNYSIFSVNFILTSISFDLFCGLSFAIVIVSIKALKMLNQTGIINI